MKVIVYKGANDQYRWRLIDQDRMVSHSELFATEEQALEAAEEIAEANDAEVENRVVSPDEGEE